MTQERIIAAAIKLHGKIYSLDPPARHINVWASIPEPKPPGQETQGFITSKGRFVKRRQARGIAEDAGQIRNGAISSTELYSEDLW